MRLVDSMQLLASDGYDEQFPAHLARYSIVSRRRSKPRISPCSEQPTERDLPVGLHVVESIRIVVQLALQFSEFRRGEAGIATGARVLEVIEVQERADDDAQAKARLSS